MNSQEFSIIMILNTEAYNRLLVKIIKNFNANFTYIYVICMYIRKKEFYKNLKYL